MAGRRAAVKALDWTAFGERIPPNQKTMFNALKTRSDAIAAKLSSLPEKPAAIDWAMYRSKLASPALVDEFEKKFNALKVPEPVDNYSSKIAIQEKEADKSAQEFIQASKQRIAGYEKELEKMRNMVHVEEMTIDDLNEAFPETKLDKVKYPFWPFKPIAAL
ncbi:ATP synthase peripheral stalk subunit d, mitochondrial [Petromyzon marinus]|uniref:ATP synthase subunit d, mitochondrial n=1 Tax=Petromyzon marinus TaxID=7757 RepID=A0AAJ7TG36_PETMA|nr:ATP synthase subunit d, mitochondrial [Petromyzon marinus]XP_032817225.1 ATP synthase subunit d, mitochondrial [Petromyzon marinus]